MRDDHSHFTADDSDVCAHCGQPLSTPAPTYGERGNNRTGLVVTILLHLLLVAIYLYQPKTVQKRMASGGQPEIMYIMPGKPKPKPQEQAPKKSPKTSKPKSAPERIQVQRLPNTITLPDEKPVEKPKAEPKREPVPENMDMQAYINAKRKQRGAKEPSESTEQESDNARAMRNIMNNVASVNSRSNDDSNETGGVFSITDKTFSSATVKFRGWNPNFKRRWLTQVTVELGGERDIETAIVKKMIELIRKEKKGDFEWESHRLNKVVTMSARPEDTDALVAFLYKEMFKDYKPPRS